MEVRIIGRAIKYGGRARNPGEVIDMDRRHARIFQALGRVQPLMPSNTLTPVTTFDESLRAARDRAAQAESGDEPGHEEETVEPEGKRRRYRRRDMSAE